LAFPLILFGAAVVFVSVAPAWAEGRYKAESIARMRAGVKLMHEHQFARARDEFSEVVKAEPKLPEAYNCMGLAYYNEGKVAEAQQAYRQALEVEPLFAPALNNLGVLLYAGGHPKDALHYWKRCQTVSNNTDPDLYYYIANALRDTGAKAEARDNYLTAIKLNPKNAAAYSGLAALDLGEGRLEDALNEVKKSFSLKNDSSFSWFHLGAIEEKRNNVAGALQAYETSLNFENVAKYRAETKARIARLKAGGTSSSLSAASSPENDVLKQRALAALARHDWSEARADLETLTKRGCADDPIVWNNLGLALAGESQNQRAMEAYRHALSLRHDGFAEAQYNLGMVLRHMGDNSAAESAFRKAIDDASRKGKPNALANNMLGIVLRERADFESADKAFRRAILQSGDELPVAHYNLALLLEHNEHSREAISEYRTYLRLAPHGKNAGSAKNRLKRLTGA